MVNRFYWDRPDRGGDDTTLEALGHLRMDVSTAWAPGSSGSAVLNARGNVIGHVAFIEPLSDAPFAEEETPATEEEADSEPKAGERAPRIATLADIEAATPMITLHIATPARSVRALAASLRGAARQLAPRKHPD